MRKLLPLLLCVLFSGKMMAQVSFTVVVAPCHNDGILKATFGTVVPPLTVTWTTWGSTGVPITHTSITSSYDVLSSYSGGPVTVVARDTFGTVDSNVFSGAAPFDYLLSYIPGICPAPDTVRDSVVGGTYPYTIQWYNMATTAVVATGNPVILPDGDYGIIITDALGCEYGSRVDPSYITVASVASFSAVTGVTAANCTNGSVTVASSGGGVPPYSYSWSNGATTPSITGLITGTYGVTLTDALGCHASTSAFVPQAISISVPVTPTPATCLDTNGAVIAFPSGGMPPYTFAWSNGMTTQSQSGITAGYYSVNVIDANGCIGSGAATVGSSTPITVTYSSSPSLCTSPTGNATVAPTGGTFPYNITWYTSPAQIGVTATHLAPGNYFFRITDAAGCRQEGSVTVPPVSNINLTFSSAAAICTLSNGSIGVVPTGGAAPYSYLWNTGATTSSISSIPSGAYSVRVTDALSCSVTKSVDLSSFSPVNISAVSTPATCIFATDGINTANAYGGTSPYTYHWSTGGTTATISALSSGPYWVFATDAMGCRSPSTYSYVGYDTSGISCYCTIEGKVFADTNNNCVQDPGEPGISHVQIYISGRGYTYTNDTGYYSYKVPAGTYSVSETVLAYYPLSSCQSNSVSVTATTGTACTHVVNFANTVDTIHDMHISTWDYSLAKPVPGHAYRQVMVITNDGTVPEDSVYATYNPDGQLFAPMFTPSSIFTGPSYTYGTTGTFPTLAPGGAQNFFMDYVTPTNIPLGTSVLFRDTVVYKSPTANWVTDYSPWNNVNYFTTNVVASYDPNFKEVSPQGTGPIGLISYQDSVLEYMVHFQNTGSAPAENIVVVDTLDDDLNWVTLKPEYMSAPCKVTMEQKGAHKIATFTFTEINLPTETSSAMGSNGMLTYTIHTRPGLPVGTQFTNRASIYFDYNAPIATNTTLNTLGSTLSAVNNNVSTNEYSTFTIYPNPASQSFNAVINTTDAVTADMSITDITGKVMLRKQIALQKGQQTINQDASQLAPGMYLVTFNFNGKQQTQKLVIMK